MLDSYISHRIIETFSRMVKLKINFRINGSKMQKACTNKTGIDFTILIVLYVEDKYNRFRSHTYQINELIIKKV